MVNPPVPAITPLYVSAALVNVNVLEPNEVVPEPEIVIMDVPVFVALMSSTPLLIKPLLAEKLPEPLRPRDDPALIVVLPV